MTSYGACTHAYKADGSLLKSATWSGPITGSVSKAYDPDFRVSSEQVNASAAVAYTYDPDSLLTGAGALTIAREAASGFVTGTSLGSVTDSVSYNSYGEPQTYSASFGTTALYSVEYGTRDGLGRIVTKTETVQGVSHTYGYTYDAVGRLTDVTKDGLLASHYTYDANGNRTSAPGFFRVGLFPNYKAWSAAEILAKYGPDAEAIIAAAGRTDPLFNGLGAALVVEGGADLGGAGSRCGCAQ